MARPIVPVVEKRWPVVGADLPAVEPVLSKTTSAAAVGAPVPADVPDAVVPAAAVERRPAEPVLSHSRIVEEIVRPKGVDWMRGRPTAEYPHREPFVPAGPAI